jgi:hypothetical protein
MKYIQHVLATIWVGIGLIMMLNISGCTTQPKPDYTNIPLTSGDSPYRLPAGVYTDTRGVIHNEQNYRWSISESDLFNVSEEDYLVNIKKRDK